MYFATVIKGLSLLTLSVSIGCLLAKMIQMAMGKDEDCNYSGKFFALLFVTFWAAIWAGVLCI